MLGRVFWGIAAAVMLIRPAAADDGAPAWIPSGDGWWCFDALLSKGAETFHSSSCYRSKHTCLDVAETDRLSSTKDSLEFGRDAYQCARYKKAVGFTAHAVVQDDIHHLQFLKMQECVDARPGYVTTDYDHVSRCTVLGDVEPSAFEADLFPEGKGWYCARIIDAKGPYGCRRTRDQCADYLKRAEAEGQSVVSRCAFQAAAFATTARHEAYVVGSQDKCEEAAEALAEASRCTKI